MATSYRPEDEEGRGARPSDTDKTETRSTGDAPTKAQAIRQESAERTETTGSARDKTTTSSTSGAATSTAANRPARALAASGHSEKSCMGNLYSAARAGKDGSEQAAAASLAAGSK